MNADYVIVGAGSAGCALAYRLSEGGVNSVLIIEHGGSGASTAAPIAKQVFNYIHKLNL